MEHDAEHFVDMQADGVYYNDSGLPFVSGNLAGFTDAFACFGLGGSQVRLPEYLYLIDIAECLGIHTGGWHPTPWSDNLPAVADLFGVENVMRDSLHIYCDFSDIVGGWNSSAPLYVLSLREGMRTPVINVAIVLMARSTRGKRMSGDASITLPRSGISWSSPLVPGVFAAEHAYIPPFIGSLVPQESVSETYTSTAVFMPCLQRSGDDLHVTTLAGKESVLEEEIGLFAKVMANMKNGCIVNVAVMEADGRVIYKEVRETIAVQ